MKESMRNLFILKVKEILTWQHHLYAMGVQGIFTRSLDQALLNNQIDIAVHSMKDVPVKLPAGITEAAVLERDNPFDLLVPHPHVKEINLDDHYPTTIASSSLRRRAQWLHRFPDDRIEGIRGNVNTRIEKIGEQQLVGSYFCCGRSGTHWSSSGECH